MEARLIAEAHEEQGMQTFVEKSGGIQSIEKMPGDASTRRYYRVKANSKSLVTMAMEPFTEKGANIPFLAIQKHLRAQGVDVPEVLDIDPAQGFILLEDLGDTTLLRSLQDVDSPAEEERLFQKAIDALVVMHVKTGPKQGDTAGEQVIEGFQQFFDVTKLMWEVNFTIEHFYQKHLKREFSPEDAKIIQEGFTSICSELAAEKTVFTHRDYHSRNLMVTADADPRYVMIDFQDARMGPPQYDLASLLRDSYYRLSEPQIEKLTKYYRDQMAAQGAPVIDVAKFNRLFDLMSVQRNFKAIGSFASFLNRRGNPSYLKYVGNTFENIRQNLLKYPEFKRLREVLYHYYYF